MCLRVFVKGGGTLCSASTVLVGSLRLLVQLRTLFASGDSGVIVVEALCHPLTDDVHQPLKRLLHVYVVLSAGLKELKTCSRGGNGGCG